MFERFTDRARRVVVLAQEEARLLGHDAIGTEHILLGLIHEQDGMAARTLQQLGISLEAVRSEIRSIVGTGGGTASGHIPFTPHSKKVLELSLREALQLGHDHVGTEHILLGLIADGEGAGALVLASLGAGLSSVRTAVLTQLSALGPRAAPRFGPSRSPRSPETPAAARIGFEARRLAGSGPVGSHHHLLALVAQEDSLAAKALAAMGVTREAVEQQLRELDAAGTSDENPEQAGARRITLRVEGQRIVLELDDGARAASLTKAMGGREPVIRGTDPEADGFPALWSVVSRGLDELVRRLAPTTSGRAPGARAGDPWRPPGWHPGGHAAVYWIVSTPGGTSATLECSGETDRGSLRAWLRAWLTGNGPRHAASRRDVPPCCSLWAYVDAAGDSFTMTSFGFGPDGPPGCEPVSLDVLVEWAVADLA